MLQASALLLLLGLPAAAPAEERPTLRLCTGQRSQNYHRAGEFIAERLKPDVDVDVIESRGSWDNLEAIDAEPRRCDAIIAQDDAFTLYQFEKPKSRLTMQRVAVLYPETVHLLCNRASGIEDAFDLDPKKHKVLVAEFGSGTYITWRLFGKLINAFGKIPTFEASFDEALLKVVDGSEAQCLFYVSGIRARGFMVAHDQFGDRLRLAKINDSKLFRKVGGEKRPVYSEMTVKQSTYPKLLSGDLLTVGVDAVFFVSAEWKARYPEGAKNLASALLTVIPEMNKLFKPN